MPLMMSGILYLLLDAIDRRPVELHLELAARDAAAAGGLVALGEVALAAAVMRGVDREAERAVTVLDRALDMVFDEVLVAADIELEDAQRIRRRLRDPLEPRLGDRRDHVRDAEFAGGADDLRRRARMEAFERADRRQHHRHPQLAAEPFDRGVDLADVGQDARPERDGVERHAVAPQRGLGLGRADDVVPVVLAEVLARLGDELMQVHEFRHGRLDLLGGLRCGGGGFFLHGVPGTLDC